MVVKFVSNSVTRCWNKNYPKFLRTLPKKYSQQFDLKSYVFQNSPKCQHVFGLLFVRKFVTENFQNSPNLVTLFSKTRFLLKMGKRISTICASRRRRHRRLNSDSYASTSIEGGGLIGKYYFKTFC